MEIINSSKTFTGKETYQMTRSADIGKMRDVVDQDLELKNWIIYEDTDSNGEIKRIVTLETVEGELYGTNSPSFIREFESIVQLAQQTGEELKVLGVRGGRSKNGRNFVTCTWC